MGVADGARENFVLADVGGPYVGVGQVEALLGSEAVDDGGLGAIEGLEICGVGHTETALIGDGLTEGETAVGVGVACHDDAVVAVMKEVRNLLLKMDKGE